MQAEAVLSKLQEIINPEKCIVVDDGAIAIVEPGKLQSAHCLLDFLNSILNTYHGVDMSDWPRRYFLFHNQGKNRLEKPPLHESKSNDMPEKALFLPVKNNEKIYVRKLLGKPA